MMGAIFRCGFSLTGTCRSGFPALLLSGSKALTCNQADVCQAGKPALLGGMQGPSHNRRTHHEFASLHVRAGLGNGPYRRAWPRLSGVVVPPGEPPCIAFAAQMLPDAGAMSAPSIAKWAQQAGAWLIEGLKRHEGPW